MIFYGYASAIWPEYREPTYCEYCGRRHRSSATNCDGCGAPVRVKSAAPYDVFDELLDVTTFQDTQPRFISRRTGKEVTR